MLKPFKTNRLINAKATLAFAVCTLLAVSAATLRADDDKDKSSDKDKPESSSSAVSKDSSQGAPPTQGGTATSGKLSRGDEKFVKDACMAGMKEVHMGKLGVQKAQNEQVKTYAQRLIDDHTKANTELKQLASQKGLTLPDDKFASSGETTSDSDRTKVRESESADHKEHQAHLKKLEALSGTEFDREFVRMAVKDHEKNVKEFEKASQKADDADLKAFAQKTTPTLREHLQQARSLQSQVGGGSSDSP
jgi:putative membrane protein